jgi:hypothetical protein
MVANRARRALSFEKVDYFGFVLPNFAEAYRIIFLIPLPPLSFLPMCCGEKSPHSNVQKRNPLSAKEARAGRVNDPASLSG